MSVLEFISSVLSALAWPIAVISVVIVLRRPLRHLLSRLETFKGPGVEATFQRQVEEAREEAALAVAGLPSVQKGDESQQERLEYVDLLQLADVSPRAAILETWLMIESALTEAAMDVDISPQARGSTIGLMEALKRQGVIGPEVESAVRRLRNLRNVVVHTQHLDISKDSVVDYVWSANYIVRSLKDRRTDVG